MKTIINFKKISITAGHSSESKNVAIWDTLMPIKKALVVCEYLVTYTILEIITILLILFTYLYCLQVVIIYITVIKIKAH